jgi:hypothetical protein
MDHVVDLPVTRRQQKGELAGVLLPGSLAVTAAAAGGILARARGHGILAEFCCRFGSTRIVIQEST